MIINNTSKFKTTIVSIRFKEEIKKDNVGLRALLPNVMSASTPKFRTRKALNEALENLYGASVSARTYKFGKLSIIEFSLSIINPSFMDDGFFNLSLEVLNEMIYGHKNLPKKYFELEKRLLLEKIDAYKNDKTSLSLNRLFEEMFKDERYGIRVRGETEDVLPLQYEDLNKYYQEFLKTNDCDVLISGDISDEEVSLIKKYFKTKNIYKHTPIEEETHETADLNIIKEYDDINQAKLNIGYNLPIQYGDDLYNAAILFNLAFGGSVHSRLFRIVREKHSLCYYILSTYEGYKGLFYIYTGIDKDNVDFALELINEQIIDLQTNLLSEEELNLSKKSIINDIKQVEDSQQRSTQQRYVQKLLGSNSTVEERIEAINKVKPIDVLNVAKLVKPDTIYLLSPEEK